MKLSIICFSKSGYELMKSMREMLTDSRIESDFQIVSACHKCKALSEELGFPYYQDSVEAWAKEQFAKGYAILFIGATGIAVRAIASSVKNKLTDSPVLVMDDMGKFVIPLLSGHVGGANELALQLSSLTGAIPVITTATDIHDTLAIDVWAKEHDLTIMNKEAIAHVSGMLLAGKCPVCQAEGPWARPWCQSGCPWGTPNNSENSNNSQIMHTDIWIGTEPPSDGISNTTLWLQPKEYILGIGCKKGKTEEEIRAVIEESIHTIPVFMHQICAITSIDAKKEESGILVISEKERIPFITYSAEELRAVKGEFHESNFVRQQMGVGSVCERAAVLPDHELVLPKFAKNGVTVAVARRRVHAEALIVELNKSLRNRCGFNIIN